MIATAFAALLAVCLQNAPPNAPQAAPQNAPQDAPPSAAPAAPALEPIEISLEDALHLALQNNLSIAGARLDAQATVEQFGSEWGAFDTVFNAGASWDRITTAPSPANFAGGIDVGGNAVPVERTTTAWTTGFAGQFLTGTRWSFDIGPRQVETQGAADPDDPTDDGFDEVTTGEWNLNVVQPLLRGGGDYARSALVVARHDAHAAALDAEQLASDTLQSVTTAYWLVVFARQDTKTRELSVQLATELLDITRRKFEQGLQNKIEVTQAEAELATRREELLTAQNTEKGAEDNLRELVFAPSAKDAWNRPLVATTQPEPPQSGELDVDKAIDVALSWRADVAAERERLERAEVDVERADNQADPQLDLTAGYGINSNQNTYLEAYQHLKDTNYDETSVALAFSLPIGNRSAGYALRRSEVARERQGVALRNIEMTAVGDVRAAVRQVELQRLRVQVTAEATRLQQEVYDGEVKRLENDLSTPYNVQQFQRDLLTAIDNETRARLDLEIARSLLLASQGQLLQAYGFERSMPELSLTDAPPAP
ncbi:MAG TPA: TolC family protein [Planctomycetota bacterium]|nr:TolC family protein [Planctomycetota bacterium]